MNTQPDMKRSCLVSSDCTELSKVSLNLGLVKASQRVFDWLYMVVRSHGLIH